MNESAANAPESVDPTSTVALVRRARDGDPRASDELIRRFYDRWLLRYHGKLGTEVRRLCDTVDLVQSAVADAFRSLGDLRDEALFFTWVTTIIRHKVALRYRQNRRLRSLASKLNAPSKENDSQAKALESAESYVGTLDAILTAFPDRPNWMTALVWRHLDGLEVSDIAKRLGIPERTAFHWIRSGVQLLGRRLSSRAGERDK